MTLNHPPKIPIWIKIPVTLSVTVSAAMTVAYFAFGRYSRQFDSRHANFFRLIHQYKRCSPAGQLAMRGLMSNGIIVRADWRGTPDMLHDAHKEMMAAFHKQPRWVQMIQHRRDRVPPSSPWADYEEPWYDQTYRKIYKEDKNKET